MSNAADGKYVFVSYASPGGEGAMSVVAHLERAGLPCWIAPRDVVKGEDYSQQINAAIQRASVFVICLSKAANESIYVRAEAALAFGHCPVFPVRLENVLPEGGLSVFVKINQWTDAFGRGRKRDLDQLAAAIGRVFGQAVVPMPPPSTLPADEPEASPLGSDEALRVFVGPNAARFFEKWRGLDRRASGTGWSFPAFFLGALWLAYRKLWVWAAGVLACWAGLTFIAARAERANDPAVGGLCAALGLGIALFLGLRIDGLYRAHARAKVERINQPDVEREHVADRLTLAGGVSWPAALGTGVVWFVVAAAIAGGAVPSAPVVENTVDMVTAENMIDDTLVDNMTAVDSIDNVADTMTPTAPATPIAADTPSGPPVCSDGRDRKVTVRNNTGKTIYYLTGTNTATQASLSDRLGRGVLPASDSREVTWDDGSCGCSIEIRATFKEQSDHIDYKAIDVCESGLVTLNPRAEPEEGEP